MLRRLLLALASLVLIAAPLLADVLVLKDGRRIEGRIVAETASTVRISTRLGELEFARSEIASIEKGKTKREEYEEKKAAAETAEDFYQLGLWAEEKRMRRETRECMERATELDAQHAGAHTWLGHVEYKGEWMTPEERERRMAADREAEMRAKGLVQHEGRWVTPEEKAKLEQGLVLVDGRWLPFEEAQRARGLELHEGEWLPRVEALARQNLTQAAVAANRRFLFVVNEQACVCGPIQAPALEEVADGLIVGRAWFDQELGTAPGLALLGDRLAEFYLFGAEDAPYLDTIETFASWTDTLPEGWAPAVRRVHGFVYWDPFPLSSARQWHRSGSDLIGHCYHHWGHLLLNRLGYDGRLLPPWYDESFAALMEHHIHQRNAVFCRASATAGRGTSARAAGFSFDPAILREGDWRKILREALAANRVPQFDNLAKKEFTELELLDVAIGMGVIEWLLELSDVEGGVSAMAAFHGVLREGAPELPARVTIATGDRRALYERAFQAAAGLGLNQADQAWRSWFRAR